MESHHRNSSTGLPPPPTFARGVGHSGSIRGCTKRRHHHFSDKNVVDLRRLNIDNSNHTTATNNNNNNGNCYNGNDSSNNNNNNNNNNSSTNSSSSRGSGHRLMHSSSSNGKHRKQQQSPQSRLSLISPCRGHGPLHCSTSGGYEPPTKILDFLYLGGVRDATNAEFLRREGITTILNISREEYWSVDRSIVVYPFAVDDTTDANIQQFFRPTFTLLEAARRAYYESKLRHTTTTTTTDTATNANTTGTSTTSPPGASPTRSSTHAPRVLVHCQRGRSRSATIVLAYLIRRNGWTVAEALRYVSRRRPRVEPNLGFIDALLAWQESMDTAARTRRCGSLCLAVRNLAGDTPTSVVHKFFEDYVGCVREVMMHIRPPSHAEKPHSEEEEQEEEEEEEMVDIHNADTPTLVPQPPPPPPPTTTTTTATLLSTATTTTTTTTISMNGASDLKPMTATSSRSNSSKGDGDNTLCLVFFAAAESVRMAKKLYVERPELFEALGVVAGKKLRLTIPTKLLRFPKESSSSNTAQTSDTEAATVSDTPEEAEAAVTTTTTTGVSRKLDMKESLFNDAVEEEEEEAG
ncbi:putative dual-specificity protein phosphatase [Trypanosoma theileri]|uniref:protein-tyrosine-phosphatase n=1 Tax=Trypanosoma theileri TaxID=67003 RepID=A0A1X0NNY7_9TRYP|nr:putative dual-specificity protein phosphatase [Trypanosoma theileri]ORC86415.1 putative dual-specificity protein phosphatase [Trypanosoma theileri]